jgi:hypothetical protein
MGSIVAFEQLFFVRMIGVRRGLLNVLAKIVMSAGAPQRFSRSSCRPSQNIRHLGPRCWDAITTRAASRMQRAKHELESCE